MYVNPSLASGTPPPPPLEANIIMCLCVIIMTSCNQPYTARSYQSDSKLVVLNSLNQGDGLQSEPKLLITTVWLLYQVNSN